MINRNDVLVIGFNDKFDKYTFLKNVLKLEFDKSQDVYHPTYYLSSELKENNNNISFRNTSSFHEDNITHFDFIEKEIKSVNPVNIKKFPVVKQREDNSINGLFKKMYCYLSDLEDYYITQLREKAKLEKQINELKKEIDPNYESIKIQYFELKKLRDEKFIRLSSPLSESDFIKESKEYLDICSRYKQIKFKYQNCDEDFDISRKISNLETKINKLNL